MPKETEKLFAEFRLCWGKKETLWSSGVFSGKKGTKPKEKKVNSETTPGII